MADYDFACKKCGKEKRDVVIPISYYDELRPKCCGEIMPQVITRAPIVHWVGLPFKNQAFKTVSAPMGQNEVITSERQHREYLKKHDLVVAETPPPSFNEIQKERAEVAKSIEAITPTDAQDDGRHTIL